MHNQDDSVSLLDDESLEKKIRANYHKNLEDDHTASIDLATQSFNYSDCKDEFWNPEKYSLFYGTALWEEASAQQKVILNQLFWVAYFSQIISAEIATIYFNQTSAAGLYSLKDFRIVCDMLDLESEQERSHIEAFKTIGEATEQAIFGKTLFSFPMRTPFAETMIFHDTNRLRLWWKKWQLRMFGMISADNAFVACQYFTVRGLRTMNGRIVQRHLSHNYSRHKNKPESPVPSQISYYHFMDESYHYYSSKLISHEILQLLEKPTPFEKLIANMGIRGCQKDHYNFSTAINGIFWYDPALYEIVYGMLRSPVFGMDAAQTKVMMYKAFAEESTGAHESYKTHRKAMESYKEYVADLEHVSKDNKEMSLMSTNSLEKHLAQNKRELNSFFRDVERRCEI